MSIESGVEDLITNLYGEDDFLKNPDVRNDKIIHEPLYGTSTYTKHEIAILDSPFVQRLKNIHQLGLAYQVYPGARYSRFEHSLGVMYIARKFSKTLKKTVEMDDETIDTLKAAALLHDIGHGPFSHSSEIFMMSYPEMQELKNKLDCKPHEILSYYIVKSKLVQEFLATVKTSLGGSYDIEEISNYILGKSRDESDQFKADIINGEFDADKLDYVTRDGHFTGLPISVDVDRILYSVDVDIPEGIPKIVLDRKGISSIQQLLFDKVVLKHTVYNHHKVRALDAMTLLIYEKIRDNNIEINGISLKRPWDMIAIEDHHILNLSNTEDEELNNLVKMIKYRRLFKKALVISHQTVINPNNLQGFSKIGDYPQQITELRKALAEYIGCSSYEIAIDIPEYPSTREASQDIIRFGPGEFGPTKRVFPTQNWLENFSVVLWEARIFARPDKEFRKIIGEKAKEFFAQESEAGLNFNEKAITLTNIN